MKKFVISGFIALVTFCANAAPASKESVEELMALTDVRRIRDHFAFDRPATSRRTPRQRRRLE